MAINGAMVSGRFLAMVPNIVPICLLSRGAGESGYTPYAWLGRELPSEQSETLTGNIVVSHRVKVLEVFKVAQTVDPKEEDQFYAKIGSVEGKWGIWTIRNLDVQFNRWVFKGRECLWSKDIIPLSILPSTLPAGTVGVAYSQTITASNGYGAKTYAVSSGTLPTSLALNTSTGVITGIPMVTGTYAFTITATDAGFMTISQAYSVVIT